jgi:hypothetical protein
MADFKEKVGDNPLKVHETKLGDDDNPFSIVETISNFRMNR